jgi:hypothetical protein
LASTGTDIYKVAMQILTMCTIWHHHFHAKAAKLPNVTGFKPNAKNMNPDNCDFEIKVSEEYAKYSHFGYCLSLDLQGIKKVSMVITSWLDETNIDHVAEKGCSNVCELFFQTRPKLLILIKIVNLVTDIQATRFTQKTVVSLCQKMCYDQ